MFIYDTQAAKDGPDTDVSQTEEFGEAFQGYISLLSHDEFMTQLNTGMWENLRTWSQLDALMNRVFDGFVETVYTSHDDEVAKSMATLDEELNNL